jgi:D-glycero-alpha-D-manno-heptose-7-phosphate kinase
MANSSSIVRAPVRVSFGGGGTDLAAYYRRFGGFVVSAAISRYCYVVARPAADRGIRITSADYRIWESYARDEIPAVQEPLILPKVAIEWFADRGLRETGVDLFLTSEVPPGTGLGSSSAMAVALVRALAAYLHLPMGTAEVAELASWLEIDRLAMPIGKQDQYASAFGGLNALTFRTDGVCVNPLDLPPDVTSALGSRLLLFASGRSRHSAQILAEQRSDTGAKPEVTESLHRLKELAEEMCAALKSEDLDRFGRLLDEGWHYKKRLSGKISSATIDEWYDAARQAGALGGKITGAGGGGFLLLYCPLECQPSVRDVMARLGLREMTFDFDFEGARVLTSAEEQPGDDTSSNTLLGSFISSMRSLDRQPQEGNHA